MKSTLTMFLIILAGTGSKSCDEIGIPSPGEIDWCNPPGSLEMKITDEVGDQKSIFLPLGF